MRKVILVLTRLAMLIVVVLTLAGCGGDGAAPSGTTPPPADTSTPPSDTSTPPAVSAPVTWFVPDGAALTAAQITSLFDTKQLYFNVLSAANGSGEIRGEIAPSPVSYQTDAGDPFAPNPANNPVTFAALLGGEQVRPRNVVTSASGYGSVTINPVTGQLSGFIVSSGIVGSSARIHDGLPGSSGASVVSLEGGPLVWTVPSGTVLSGAQMARLSSGALYFSVQSSSFPDGEIRGQLNQQIRFASLLGSSEVPPVATSGSAVGLLAVTQSTAQFSGFVKVAGLTSTIRSVALHIGAAGTNGVGITFLQNRGNGLWSIPANTVLSSAQVASFNNGELYYNIHTDTNIGGEVRGQLTRATVRIGTATLDGAREVPAVTTTATGTGILAWNSVTGLASGSVSSDKVTGTAAQLQSGTATTLGPAVISLTTSTPVSVAPSAGISFALDILPIFNVRCSGVACHTAGGIAPMSLEPSVAYVNISTRVVPGNALASTLYQRLTGAILPQMPLVGGPLNTASLDLVRNWIDRGALNN